MNKIHGKNKKYEKNEHGFFFTTHGRFPGELWHKIPKKERIKGYIRFPGELWHKIPKKERIKGYILGPPTGLSPHRPDDLR